MTATIGLVLDCADPDRLAAFWCGALEATRVEGLGARRLEAGMRSEHGTNWVIMADPEDNEFCVCDGGAG